MIRFVNMNPDEVNRVQGLLSKVPESLREGITEIRQGYVSHGRGSQKGGVITISKDTPDSTFYHEVGHHVYDDIAPSKFPHIRETWGKRWVHPEEQFSDTFAAFIENRVSPKLRNEIESELRIAPVSVASERVTTMASEGKALHLSSEEARKLVESSQGLSDEERQTLLSSMSAKDREKAESNRLGRLMSSASQMGGDTEPAPKKFSLRSSFGTKGQSGYSPADIASGAGKVAKGVVGAEAKLIVGGTKAVSGAAKEVAFGTARGIGMSFNDIFGTPRGQVNPMVRKARGISTQPIGRIAARQNPLRSSGLELLGRDDKVYKLSPIAPSRGVRGAVDYDALEGVFGPTGLFTRDQAVKVLVNIHSSAGQSLYGIIGRFAHMVREGYILPVEGLTVPQQPAGDESGIYAQNDPHGIWSSKF